MDETPLAKLATFLRLRGLSAATREGSCDLQVANPISSKLTEVVRLEGDSFVTSWGYDLGHVGDEPAAAARLAFLMGVPSESDASADGAAPGNGLRKEPRAMDRALLVGAAEQPRPDGRLASAMGERRLHLAALSAAISQSGERLSYGLVRRAGGLLVLCVMSDTGRFRSMDVGCERVGDAWWFVQADTGEGLVPALSVRLRGDMGMN